MTGEIREFDARVGGGIQPRKKLPFTEKHAGARTRVGRNAPGGRACL
jgi:hypothetical protein